MAVIDHLGGGYHLSPRLPLEMAEPMERPSRVWRRMLPSRVQARDASSTTCTKADANLCEKPASSDNMAVPIALGIA